MRGGTQSRLCRAYCDSHSNIILEWPQLMIWADSGLEQNMIMQCTMHNLRRELRRSASPCTREGMRLSSSGVVHGLLGTNPGSAPRNTVQVRA